MVFSSLAFIFVFLPIVLVFYHISPFKYKNIILLGFSVLFYTLGEPKYILLIIISMMINYILSILMYNNRNDKEKKNMILFTIVLFNIGILIFFKYYSFLIDNINIIFNSNLRVKEISLPLGISFYTFQLISYIVDVYRGKIIPQRNIIKFSLYVLMFPQLVAGPIVVYSDIEKQIDNRKITLIKFGQGVERFIIGLGKKVIIANNLGIIWSEVKLVNQSNLSLLSAWIGIIAFTLQIYFDFSGYSDMAIGLGKMFGFDFLENFNLPYISKSITEFWRRWHISLGSWFKEYLYIPLGGNRRGELIQLRNIIIVWFTTGLWHGASWNFIVWGLYFGSVLYLEKTFFKKLLKRLPGRICNLYTMLIVVIGWVFFDFENISVAIDYIKVMFGFGSINVDNLGMYLLRTNIILIIISIMLATGFFDNTLEKMKKFFKLKDLTLILFIKFIIFIISISYLVSESYNPFLYFRF
ncbi:MBOAT family O-acyltransferase [Clostridium nigeriense]|uniref:MBOAT family O-acyltransferase n=1 Tax=Clostridium nigeriense TaxID=1805470 RepID=UPI0008303B94|nr:MBOAT family O-acyltransferase [Clostridium nigeriense]